MMLKDAPKYSGLHDGFIDAVFHRYAVDQSIAVTLFQGRSEIPATICTAIYGIKPSCDRIHINTPELADALGKLGVIDSFASMQYGRSPTFYVGELSNDAVRKIHEQDNAAIDRGGFR